VRPTVEEHLRRTAQSLQDFVAPVLEPGPAASVLTSVVKSLEALAAGCDRVLPFLHEDNTRLEQLLTAHASDRLRELGPRPHGPPPAAAHFDVAAVALRNEQLREVLSSLVTAPDCPRDLLAESARLLGERARRYPIRLVPDLPSARTDPAAG
jgi:hypothetical protein